MAGTDYTLSYVNNRNVGTATVTITGKGNYSGTISKTFTIFAAYVNVVSVGENVTAGYDSRTGKVTFYSQGGTLSTEWINELDISASDIKSLTISNDSDVMYLPRDSSFLFSNLSNLQSLNLFKTDTTNVTNMSGMFKDCYNLKSLNLIGFDTSNVTDMSEMFIGCESLQELDLSNFDVSNVNSMDYMFYDCGSIQELDLSSFDMYSVNSAYGMMFGLPSELVVIMTPVNVEKMIVLPYTFVDAYGTEYETLPQDLSESIFLTKKGVDIQNIADATVTGITNETYTGMYIYQYPTVKMGNKTLNIFTDYKMSYSNNINPGTATVKIIGNGNYSGSISKTFTISGASIAGATITGISNKIYTGLAQTQNLTVELGDKMLVENIDYTLSYTNNMNVGTATVVITGKGNYSGTISKTFTISAMSITGTTVSGVANKTYTGLAQTQNLTLTRGDKTLVAGTDYTLSYTNNTNAGTATVTITGKGNYSGTISKTFTIRQVSPKLTFTSSNISKTTQNAAFTNLLTKITDGTVTFKSSNTSVATVNSTSGKVTIKGAGTTVITATAAAGTNYKAGSAQYTLTVTKVLNIFSLSDDFYGKTGTPAAFHIEAEGSGSVSYQWQYRTAGSTSWKTPSQASAKTADYVFNLRPSYDNIEVRCIVSDEFGNEIISETRKANVFAYTSQPKDATAAEGQAVNFEVSAIGRCITYQWYYKRPNSTWKKAAVSESKTAVLPITAGTKNDGTSYRCVITDEAGNKITSAAGTLTLETPLQITGMSEDAYDLNGKNVTFHIDVVGNGDLSYQWQYKLAGETEWRTPGLASAKTADYVFKLRPSYDNIEVRCIVKDASGNSVTSDVRKANVFAITSQPQDTELALGEKTTFAVEAVGRELTYQWYYMRPEGSWKKVIVAGYNTASLVITANTKNNGTKFRCHITDGLGNMLVSAAATLTQS